MACASLTEGNCIWNHLNARLCNDYLRVNFNSRKTSSQKRMYLTNSNDLRPAAGFQQYLSAVASTTNLQISQSELVHTCPGANKSLGQSLKNKSSLAQRAAMQKVDIWPRVKNGHAEMDRPTWAHIALSLMRERHRDETFSSRSGRVWNIIRRDRKLQLSSWTPCSRSTWTHTHGSHFHPEPMVRVCELVHLLHNSRPRTVASGQMR